MSFAARLSEFGDRIALIAASTGEQISYTQLAERCDKLAGQLPATKSLLALGCTNDINTVLVYLTCLRQGHALLLYDALLTDSRIKVLLAQYQPDLHYVNGILHHADSTAGLAVHSDLALCLSTSGSTGSPKLVRLSLQNIQSNTDAILSTLPLSATDVALTSLPVHYSYGLSVLNTHLAVGACVVLSNESIVTRAFWDAFTQYQITSFSGVPSHYEMLERLRFRRMDLPSLKYLTQAGGALSVNLVETYAQYAAEKNRSFFVMYGQTEACARMACLPAEMASLKPGSIGKPIPGGLFSLIDDQGKYISAPDETGELVYQGANVMMGYASSREDLLKGDELKGILRTGDLARQDSEGFFYIQGRLQRFLKLHGNRFALDELELALRQQNHDCICGGIDNQLIVLTREQHKVSIIETILSQTYHLHHSSYKVLCKEAFPVSSSGKIQYQLLQELAV